MEKAAGQIDEVQLGCLADFRVLELSCQAKAWAQKDFLDRRKGKKRKRCHGSLVFSVLDIKLALFRWNGLTSICVHNKEASFLDLRAPDLFFLPVVGGQLTMHAYGKYATPIICEK